MNSTNKQVLSNKIINIIGIYVLLSFSGCVMAVFRKMFFQSAGYKFLIWNLFLAWIPLVISIFILYIYDSRKHTLMRTVLITLLGVIWVAFYPNSPYIVTDFIHLSGLQYYFTNIGYEMNFIIWYDFIMISLFILTGFLIGFISLYIIQALLIDKFNKLIGWIFACAILFISSYGIYLGRFIRWNSWDIVFRPKVLINSILVNSKHYAFEFTVSFGLFLILIYFALYCLTTLGEHTHK